MGGVATPGMAAETAGRGARTGARPGSRNWRAAYAPAPSSSPPGRANWDSGQARPAHKPYNPGPGGAYRRTPQEAPAAGHPRPQGLFLGRPVAPAMPGEQGGLGRFGFVDWSDGEFRARFVAIIGKGGKKNNTYKFAMARFLLDLCCDPCMMLRAYGRQGDEDVPGTADTADGIQVEYAEIARYFFAYYWPLACNAGLRQGPAKPKVVTAIEREFGEKKYEQSACQIIRDEPEKVGRCLKEIARVMPLQVGYRLQKVCGDEIPMFYQYAAGPADNSGNRRIDPKGGILVNPNAVRFFRENYGALNKAVALEWLRATATLNPGAPDLAGRFLKAYDWCENACEFLRSESGGTRGRQGDYGGCENACEFLPGLEAAGRHCFYCGARPSPDERMCIDHFLPADYVGRTEEWNLVLACQGCGRKKACMLAPPEYVDMLARRNARRREAGAREAVPLGKMTSIERGLGRHYSIAKRRGYPVAESLATVRP